VSVTDHIAASQPANRVALRRVADALRAHPDIAPGDALAVADVLDDVVMGRDGSWMAPFVGEAGELGRRRATAQVAEADSAPLESSSEISILQPDGQRHCNSLAVSELRGLIA
jgi:hypothetical protein